MEFSNKDKSQHGQQAQQALTALLESCQSSGFIEGFETNFRQGVPGHTPNQFYTPFLVTMCNGKKWALFSTTSMRTDRIKGQQWDAYNLKQIVSDLDQVLLIYPDAIPHDEIEKFQSQNSKYIEWGGDYSEIDGIQSQTELRKAIENYYCQEMTEGKTKDLKGRMFEKAIADILSYPGNLSKWKYDDHTNDGQQYNIFLEIVRALNLNKYEVSKISATNDSEIIGLLPSGGLPKTDILVTVSSVDGTTTTRTISCKRSECKWVTVHQYKANAFANVLDPENLELAKILNKFQQTPSLAELGQDNAKLLTEILSPYLLKLELWVMGGIGGAGDPATQWAQYILSYNENQSNIQIHSIEDYCDNLNCLEIKGNFGTPFIWTYASKHRGSSIQLKSKIL